QQDIDNFKGALRGVDVVEAFLPVAAPASVIPDRKNEYYKSDDDLQQAIADAMHAEYKMIIDAGLLVQLDDARAAVSYDRMVPPKSLKEYRAWLARQVEIINHAIKGLPRENIRYHICWGSWPGPHTSDVPFKDIADLVLKVRAGGYSIELANPRHEHEWRLWEQLTLPKDTVLIPGVISHATNIVEHPELVAERIVRLARLVGRENVIASTDCGFAQVTYFARVHPQIMWAKLEALVDGARLASNELWRKGAKRRAVKGAARPAARRRGGAFPPPGQRVEALSLVEIGPNLPETARPRTVIVGLQPDPSRVRARPSHLHRWRVAMPLAPTLQKHLDQNVTYEVITHDPTMSSTRTAQACHVSGDRLAKAIVL